MIVLFFTLWTLQPHRKWKISCSKVFRYSVFGLGNASIKWFSFGIISVLIIVIRPIGVNFLNFHWFICLSNLSRITFIIFTASRRFMLTEDEMFRKKRTRRHDLINGQSERTISCHGWRSLDVSVKIYFLFPQDYWFSLLHHIAFFSDHFSFMITYR